MKKSNFLYDFKRIIREADYDNTYKMAWAKALVEIAYEDSSKEEVIKITLSRIAEKVIKYYWNHTIYFDLIQGSNPQKPPVIISLTKKLINEYKKITDDEKPLFFEKAKSHFISLKIEDKYQTTIDKMIKALKENVSWRFLNLGKETLEDIYQYNKGDNFLLFTRNNLLLLKENLQDLFDLINYRWSLILETFNSSPRINKKVRIIDDNKIKRSNLKKYSKYLDIQNPNHVCFICGEKINDEDLSIDHVIPWSYLYSDDLWNLVYVHRSCNSCKSNIIPGEEEIEKLKIRNNELKEEVILKELKDTNIEGLILAIEKDYVNKFWIGSKG